MGHRKQDTQASNKGNTHVQYIKPAIEQQSEFENGMFKEVHVVRNE